MQLQIALKEFLTSLRALNRADATIEWYGHMLNAYVDWLTATGRNGADLVRPATIETFLDAERQHVKKSTVAARYRALRPFYKWMKRRGYLGDHPNPFESLKEPKSPKGHMPRQASPEQVAELLASIGDDDWLALRDAALVLMLAHAGLRLSEVTALRIEHLDLDECMVHVVEAKGDKQRLVPFGVALCKSVRAYIDACPAFESGTKPKMWLWWGSDGWQGVRKPLKSKGLQEMLQRRCEAAGMDNLNPHSFRHGYALMMLEKGADISFVADLLGHESVETTRDFYLKWQKGRKKALFQRIWGD